MDMPLWKAKLRASTLHICISLLVATLIGVVVFFVWYPNPFGFAGGGLKLFLLVSIIDLILGPLLTFVVFNPLKKRSLMLLDFSVIAALQFSALVYGVNVVYVGRPVAVVFEGNRFRVVRASDIAEKELQKAKDGFRQLSMSGPKLIGTRPVTDAEQSEALDRAMKGEDIGMRPEFWVDYKDCQERAKPELRSIDILLKRFPDQKSELEEIAKRAGVRLDQLGFLPAIANTSMFSVLIRRDNGSFVAYVLLDGTG